MTLQKLAYNNPVATAEIFNKRVNLLVKHAMGHDLAAKRTVRLDTGAKRAAFGVSAWYSDVTECNSRDSEHIHGKGGGAISGQLLADVAAFPALRATAMGALDTQAAHGSTRQHTAAHGSSRQHTAAHRSPPQHPAAHGSTRQPTAAHRSTRQHTTAHGSTRQHTRVVVSASMSASASSCLECADEGRAPH